MEFFKNSTITVKDDDDKFEFLVVDILEEERKLILLDLDNDTVCEAPFEQFEEPGLIIDVKKYGQ